MREEIKKFNRALKLLKSYTENLKIVACCCGHGKYRKTIVIKEKASSKDEEDKYFEHFSLISIPRNRNFYKKDKEGFYYLPELKKDFSGQRGYCGDYATGDNYLYEDIPEVRKTKQEDGNSPQA